MGDMFSVRLVSRQLYMCHVKWYIDIMLRAPAVSALVGRQGVFFGGACYVVDMCHVKYRE